MANYQSGIPQQSAVSMPGNLLTEVFKLPFNIIHSGIDSLLHPEKGLFGVISKRAAQWSAIGAGSAGGLAAFENGWALTHLTSWGTSLAGPLTSAGVISTSGTGAAATFAIAGTSMAAIPVFWLPIIAVGAVAAAAFLASALIGGTHKTITPVTGHFAGANR